jgi:hypothetical protein
VVPVFREQCQGGGGRNAIWQGAPQHGLRKRLLFLKKKKQKDFISGAVSLFVLAGSLSRALARAYVLVHGCSD